MTERNRFYPGVAQLVEASDLGSEGWGFESLDPDCRTQRTRLRPVRNDHRGSVRSRAHAQRCASVSIQTGMGSEWLTSSTSFLGRLMAWQRTVNPPDENPFLVRVQVEERYRHGMVRREILRHRRYPA